MVKINVLCGASALLADIIGLERWLTAATLKAAVSRAIACRMAERFHVLASSETSTAMALAK